MQKLCVRYSPEQKKNHIDMVLELMWMGNHSRRSLANALNVHYITIGDWISRQNYPEEKNRKAIEAEHRKAFVSIVEDLRKGYFGLNSLEK